MRRPIGLMLLVATVGVAGRHAPCGRSTASTSARRARRCGEPSVATPLAPTPTPLPTRIVRTGYSPVATGEPIKLADLSGRIVFDDFEDVRAMDVDGSDVVTVAAAAGSEFDGAWSPDGKMDRLPRLDARHQRGRRDRRGRGRRLAAAEHQQRPGQRLGPGLVARRIDDRLQLGPRRRPDQRVPRRARRVERARRLDIDGWVEYASFSPDGTRIAYEGHDRRRLRGLRRRHRHGRRRAQVTRRSRAAAVGPSGLPTARRSPSHPSGTTARSFPRARSVGGPASRTTSIATSGS